MAEDCSVHITHPIECDQCEQRCANAEEYKAHIASEHSNLQRFFVNRPEVHVSSVSVMATSAEDAIARVKDGEGNEQSLTYKHTLDDDDEWSAVSRQELEDA